MKVNGKPQITNAKPSAERTNAQARGRFSEVLRAGSKKSQEDQLPGDGQSGLSTPCFQPREMSPVAPEVDVAHGADALLTSLVQEITIEAPRGADAAVNIQFDSRTLAGLHVQVQKQRDSVEVKFTTESDAVSRLLATNTPELAQALLQRGYPEPTISVQRVERTPSGSGKDSMRGSQQGRGQGQGQPRR